MLVRALQQSACEINDVLIALHRYSYSIQTSNTLLRLTTPKRKIGLSLQVRAGAWRTSDTLVPKTISRRDYDEADLSQWRPAVAWTGALKNG